MNNSDWMNSCKTENNFKTKYNTISGVIFLIFGKKTPNMRSLALRPSLFETHCRFPSKSVFFSLNLYASQISVFLFHIKPITGRRNNVMSKKCFSDPLFRETAHLHSP